MTFIAVMMHKLVENFVDGTTITPKTLTWCEPTPAHNCRLDTVSKFCTVVTLWMAGGEGIYHEINFFGNMNLSNVFHLPGNEG